MKKRIVGTILLVVMIASLCIPAFAADIDSNAGTITSADIDAEIQSQYENLYKTVYAQLEAQDALEYLDAYMEILSPGIETGVRQMYADECVEPQADFSGFQYGGTMYFHQTVNGLEADVLVTCMDRDNTLYYILNKESGSWIQAKTILVGILGAIPFAGNIVTALATTSTLLDKTAYQAINDARGYSKITTMSFGGNNGTSVLTGWPEYSSISLPSGAYNITAKRFPETDPWG